ncbi:MAG: tetraacyldisaccharide 4'-kinase [Thermodesulfovibrionales bacterium]|nr:tetraacyldisaccharide 4'-kinase [Thermodesulfovibrionales bacterium]
MGVIELLYYSGYRLKKAFALRRQKTLPSWVISIGNITAGGTGKTPAAIAVAEEALKRGLNPCILTRGYKGKLKGPCFVSRGEGPLLSAEDAGDEPVLMAEKLKGVPIVKAGDRYEGGIFAIKELNPQTPFVFILDDGFQHWSLKRNMDILLIDSRNPFEQRKLLPLGVLREPLSGMKRADIIVLTKVPEGGSESPAVKSLTAEIRKYNRSALVFLAGHRPSAVRKPSGEEVPIEELAGKDIYAFCGIGEPDSFRITLDSAGFRVKGFRAFSDHYRFKGRDIADIEAEARKCGAEWIMTTEKDIIRLKGMRLPESLVSVGIEFAAGEGFYEEIFRVNDLFQGSMTPFGG